MRVVERSEMGLCGGCRDPRWWQRHRQRWFPTSGATLSREVPTVELLRMQAVSGWLVPRAQQPALP